MLGRATTFVNGAVIGDGGRLLRSVRVVGSRIAGLDVSPRRRDLVIDLDGSVLLAGLINAHDHLELNSFGRLKWRARYANVREWIADFQPRFHTDRRLAGARPETVSDRVWAGAIKNLLSGVTTVCHHNPMHRALRWGFPIRVVRKFGLSHSLQIDGNAVAASYRGTPAAWPWIIHAAEGVDDEARAEIDALSAMGCLGPNTVLVHGVGLGDDGTAQAIGGGASLVWCPTSNHFLFERTADVTPFSAARRLAIGTDSRLSGEGDLLDELRAAAATRQISSQSLVRAVTSNAAAMLRLSGAGQLHLDGPADLTVIAGRGADPFDTVARASRRDVRLTMINGKALVADASFAPLFRGSQPAAAVRVDGAPRLLALPVARRAAALAFPEPGLEIVS